jgi:type II secretory pathway component PulF
MRFYQYTARDSTQKQVGGTIQAASEAEARQSLTKFGMEILALREILAGQQPQTPAPTAKPTPRPAASQQLPRQQTPVPQRPIQQPPQQSPYNYNQAPPPKITPPKQSQPVSIIHTAAGTDKQRFFIFSQLASAFRAGLNPAQTFHEVSQRSAGQFRPSLEDAANSVTEGKTFSQVLERYPDLYPEHVVGMVRAGEVAGFLPDAMDEVARQAESAHAFGRWFFWVGFLIVNFLLSIPGIFIVRVAMLNMIDDVNKTGGAGGAAAGLQAYKDELWKALLWPWGPITLGIYAALWVFKKFYMARTAKHFRHSVGLKWPVYGKRARHENLARFAWTMSRVSRAGVAPAQAWQLAANSVPNLTFRDELLNIGSQMRDQTRMSDIIHRSPIFPEEYAPYVATAEYTGDLPGAMEQLSRVSAGEFMAAQNYAKIRSGCWGFLGCFVTSGIGAIIFAYAWYNEVPKKVLGNDMP